ncbi:MAG: ParB/RepB/Spo0J family partition protein [Rhodocyclaceae bacterium]|jgi:ParB family chromosome partitioning protein|nr:ParB/RepB/Spo0J family partition protein [Rhodocyclaceae bacterium]MCA3133887.1 ParB/RepB/Spo0J family partition protein [Rhodocyclaceae bacterium]MCA3147217.1 ParB/RepB/Spo0J family partition protein [Rhodocyclaceae bacterium]
MVKVKGLGRGLDALLGEQAAPAPQGDRLLELSPAQLRPGRYQPRTNMNPEAIEALAASLRAQGMVQPILARPMGNDGFEIIAGERRWRAAQAAGLERVPVLVREVGDEAALATALVENIQREQLNAIEEATGVQRLLDEFGMTHQSAAEAIGRSRSAVSNLLRLLALPVAIQQMLITGELQMGHARALLPLDAPRQFELAQRIAKQGLSVREAERAAGSPKQGLRSRPRTNADIRRLEEELSDRLAMRVQVLQGKGRSGRLVIHYGSLDQLDTVLLRLRTHPQGSSSS